MATSSITSTVGVIRQCGECSKLLPSKPAEPLLLHVCPAKPWQKVGSDLFHWAGKMYVIILDYFSFWPEVYLLGKPDSTNVIHAIKEAFSQHGIPQEPVHRFTSKSQSMALERFLESPTPNTLLFVPLIMRPLYN